MHFFLFCNKANKPLATNNRISKQEEVTMMKINKEEQKRLEEFAQWCYLRGVDFSLIKHNDETPSAQKILDQYYLEEDILTGDKKTVNDSVTELLTLLPEKEFIKHIKVLQDDNWWWLCTKNAHWIRGAAPSGGIAIVGNLPSSALAGVRPAICINPDYLNNVEWTGKGKYFKFGWWNDKPIKWILLDEESGLSVAKKPLFDSIFSDSDTSDYLVSDLRRQLKELQEEIFSEGERDMLLSIEVNTNIDDEEDLVTFSGESGEQKVAPPQYARSRDKYSK